MSKHKNRPQSPQAQNPAPAEKPDTTADDAGGGTLDPENAPTGGDAPEPSGEAEMPPAVSPELLPPDHKRPSLEEFVQAGYPAEDYERRMRLWEADVAEEFARSREAAQRKPDAETPEHRALRARHAARAGKGPPLVDTKGHVLCLVVGPGSVRYRNREIPEGEKAYFLPKDAEEMPQLKRLDR